MSEYPMSSARISRMFGRGAGGAANATAEEARKLRRVRFISKCQFKRHLHHPRIPRRGADLAELIARGSGIGEPEVRRVGQVEGLRANLQLRSVAQVGVLDQGHVEVRQRRSANVGQGAS